MESHGGNVELLGIDRRHRDGSASRAAATAARPRPRRWSWRSSRRSTRRRPTSRGWSSRARCPRRRRRRPGRARPSCRWSRSRPGPRSRRAGSTSSCADRLQEGELRAASVNGFELVVARVEGNAARLPRPLRRLRRGARRRRAPRGDAGAAPSASGASSYRGRGGRSTTTGCCSSRCRCSRAPAARGWRCRLARPDERVAGREARRPPPGGDGRRPAPAGARPGERQRAPPRRRPPEEACDLCGKPLDADHRHLLNLVDRQHPLHLRELPGAARRRPRAAPDRHPHRLARRLRALRRDLGLVRGPDRARVLHRLERQRRDRGALPEPGRGDRVRAGDRAPGASCGPTTRC